MLIDSDSNEKRRVMHNAGPLSHTLPLSYYLLLSHDETFCFHVNAVRLRKIKIISRCLLKLKSVKCCFQLPSINS
jgi:hypothetical protein